jgi:diadenylate cyclase
VLDILIVAWVLYVILRWFRRTHAWVLLRGILFIIVMAVLAGMFDLYALMWLVSHATPVVFVIIVILFQPELRKALEQIGRGKYLSPFMNEAEQKVHIGAQTVNEIITAVATLSKTNTGALIVLERDTDLREYERDGVPLDAQVSAQLLLNIFERNTPLHDGAVIIRENRVAAASCILPLTAEQLDSELGTRHRAAIGMSEISDARVVVVSEETGNVSVVVAGAIERGVTENRMRDLLILGRPHKRRFSLFRRLGTESAAKR